MPDYTHQHLEKELWEEFVFSKQTFRELGESFEYSKKQLRRMFEGIKTENKIHNPRGVNLVVDATFFGKKETRQWGVVVFRDWLTKEDLWWQFVEDETTLSYQQGKLFLEEKGYEILSVTCDGLPGLINVFNGIPVQFCHFHQTQIIRRYVTENPKLIQGHDLLELVQCLTLTTENIFRQRLSIYIDRHRNFLNEKTTDIITNKSFFTHQRLRSAIHSLIRNLPYLFIYQKYSQLNIPNTTNALESHFSHIKDVVRIHRGLSIFMKQKMTHSILLNSSIALKPKRKK